LSPLICSDRARWAIRLAEYGFATVAFLALGYCAAVYGNAEFFQAMETHSFARQAQPDEIVGQSRSREIATPTIRHGEVVGRVDIPRLGLWAMVIEGVGHGELERAAGHIPGTAFPGEPGNIAIAAHRDTFFRTLRFIQLDDVVILSTLGATYHYRVVSTAVVAPEDIRVLYPTRHDSLTLVTCFPFSYIGPAPKRFVVLAERKGGHKLN
jgi:sortase A